jgi:hypothetical protein
MKRREGVRERKGPAHEEITASLHMNVEASQPWQVDIFLVL